MTKNVWANIAIVWETNKKGGKDYIRMEREVLGKPGLRFGQF